MILIFENFLPSSGIFFNLGLQHHVDPRIELLFLSFLMESEANIYVFMFIAMWHFLR
jgi:hypothetical protein